MTDATPSKMIGDLDALRALCATAALIATPSRGYQLVFGPGPSREWLQSRAEMEREREAARRFGANPDNVLCRWQASHGSSYPTYTIGTNIYGWSCGSMLLSNLRGGSFSCISRGSSFLDAVTYGARQASGGRAEFTVALAPSKDLPIEVVLLMAEAAGADEGDLAWIAGSEDRRLQAIEADKARRAEREALRVRREGFRDALVARLGGLGRGKVDGLGVHFSCDVSVLLDAKQWKGYYCLRVTNEGEVVLQHRSPTGGRYTLHLDVDGDTLTVGNVARAAWEATR